MTPDEEVYEEAARRLAAGELPDFSSFDSEQVGMAFVRAFAGLQPNGPWLQDLKQRVATLSGNKARLFEADPEEFVGRIKGPAGFLFLVTEGTRRRLLLTPSSTPFFFDDTNP